jgi:hypothetical protein
MRDSNMRELDGQPRRKIRGWKCCVWGTCSSGARGTVVAVESCEPSIGLERYASWFKERSRGLILCIWS